MICGGWLLSHLCCSRWCHCRPRKFPSILPGTKTWWLLKAFPGVNYLKPYCIPKLNQKSLLDSIGFWVCYEKTCCPNIFGSAVPLAPLMTTRGKQFMKFCSQHVHLHVALCCYWLPSWAFMSGDMLDSTTKALVRWHFVLPFLLSLRSSAATFLVRV